MSYLDWKVGDKVVCVDNYIEPGEPPPYLELGRVYTLSYVGPDSDGEIGVDILESPSPKDEEWGLYWPHCFRKVQPRKTDIAIFTAMLNKTGVDA